LILSEQIFGAAGKERKGRDEVDSRLSARGSQSLLPVPCLVVFRYAKLGSRSPWFQTTHVDERERESKARLDVRDARCSCSCFYLLLEPNSRHVAPEKPNEVIDNPCIPLLLSHLYQSQANAISSSSKRVSPSPPSPPSPLPSVHRSPLPLTRPHNQLRNRLEPFPILFIKRPQHHRIQIQHSHRPRGLSCDFGRNDERDHDFGFGVSIAG